MVRACAFVTSTSPYATVTMTSEACIWGVPATCAFTARIETKRKRAQGQLPQKRARIWGSTFERTNIAWPTGLLKSVSTWQKKKNRIDAFYDKGTKNIAINKTFFFNDGASQPKTVARPTLFREMTSLHTWDHGIRYRDGDLVFAQVSVWVRLAAP